jgi:energy-coupling factor transporter ATP-binding protein EcfA2
MESLVMTNDSVEDILEDDEFLEDVTEDAEDIPDEARAWAPSEYVVAILGPRGSGKSTLLARLLLKGLSSGLEVYTSLELHPGEIGIKNIPHPLTLDNLISFDPSLSDVVVGIEEVSTWFDVMRGMSTTNILASKFFQLFIRKKGLRIIFTNQSTRLPSWLWEQIDLVIYGHDLFYTEWGREADMAKGTDFYYVARDVSGMFTGRPGTTWAFGLRKANRLWPLFNSYQMFDPYQWARKTIIKGGETVFDIDENEAYSASEEGIRAWQQEVKAYSIALKKIISAYESTGFIDLATKYNAVQDLPDRMIFSVDGLRKALVNIKGKKRQDAERAYEELRVLAGQGQLARFGPRHEIIELAKPVTEANE